MNHGKKFAVLVLITALAASGCFGGKDDATPSGTSSISGPLDGSYVVTGLTCDGTPTSFLPVGASAMYVAFANLTGSVITVYSSGCVATEGQVFAYPATNQFTMQTVNQVCSGSCSGAECTAHSNVSSALAMSYSVSGSTLTISRTSSGDDGCTNGEVSALTLTKQ